MKKFWGCVALISGTAIGAGMITLPVVTAAGGFWASMLLFLLMGGFMAYIGLLILEVLQECPKHSTLITMADKTLGSWGKKLSMVAYFFLLYTLNVAYLDGLNSLFSDVSEQFALPSGMISFTLLIITMLVAYKGAGAMEVANRWLVIIMTLAFGALFFSLAPNVSKERLAGFSFLGVMSSFSVVATAFGYHVIIPSIYDYLDRDVKQTRAAVLAGTLLPMSVYMIWQWVVVGSVDYEGPTGLAAANAGGISATELLSRFSVGGSYVGVVADLFAFCALMTSFVGVSLSLIDFLADATKLKHSESGQPLLCALAFLPSLLFSWYCPRLFFTALSYAGIVVAVLIGFIPLAMVLAARLERKRRLPYRVAGGYPLMLVALVWFVIIATHKMF